MTRIAWQVHTVKRKYLDNRNACQLIRIVCCWMFHLVSGDIDKGIASPVAGMLPSADTHADKSDRIIVHRRRRAIVSGLSV